MLYKHGSIADSDAYDDGLLHNWMLTRMGQSQSVEDASSLVSRELKLPVLDPEQRNDDGLYPVNSCAALVSTD